LIKIVVYKDTCISQYLRHVASRKLACEKLTIYQILFRWFYSYSVSYFDYTWRQNGPPKPQGYYNAISVPISYILQYSSEIISWRGSIKPNLQIFSFLTFWTFFMDFAFSLLGYYHLNWHYKELKNCQLTSDIRRVIHKFVENLNISCTSTCIVMKFYQHTL
jgi:hypothetical protein